MTAKLLADKLGIDHSTVHKRVKKGQLPAFDKKCTWVRARGKDGRWSTHRTNIWFPDTIYPFLSE